MRNTFFLCLIKPCFWVTGGGVRAQGGARKKTCIHSGCPQRMQVYYVLTFASQFITMNHFYMKVENLSKYIY